MPTIEIDDDVFAHLRSRVLDFNETPNSVLRRELRLGLTPQGSGTPSVRPAPVVSEPASPASLPVSVPEALSQILDVVSVMRRERVDRVTATLRVAERRSVARETVGDKYGRQLGLSTQQFDRLLEEKSLDGLRGKLRKKFPRSDAAIAEFFDALATRDGDRLGSEVPMIILKTSGQTLPGVVKHAKHALEVRPDAQPGDLLLISQTLDSLPSGQKPIKYVMEFVRCYEDRNGESAQIWGKQWKYIIEGRNIRPLSTPFRMRDVQVTDANYLQGGPMVHVQPRDAIAIRDARLLDSASAA